MPLNVTLASSLLDLETDQHRHANKVGGRTFKTGIQALDNDLPDSLWRGGDVVAVGTEGVGIKVCMSTPSRFLKFSLGSTCIQV